MLNMKKGLAIVLAAATALTFAPVSTLGLTGVVQAQAAAIAAGTPLTETVARTSDTNDWNSTDVTTTATSDLTDEKGYFYVKITAPSSDNAGYTYKVSGLNDSVTRDTKNEDMTEATKNTDGTFDLAKDKSAVLAFQAKAIGTADVEVTCTPKTAGGTVTTLKVNFTVTGSVSKAPKFEANGEEISELTAYKGLNPSIKIKFPSTEVGNNYYFKAKNGDSGIATTLSSKTTVTAAGESVAVTTANMNEGTDTLLVYASKADADSETAATLGSKAKWKLPITIAPVDAFKVVKTSDLAAGEDAGLFAFTSADDSVSTTIEIDDVNGNKQRESQFRIYNATGATPTKGARMTGNTMNASNSALNYFYVEALSGVKSGTYTVKVSQTSGYMTGEFKVSGASASGGNGAPTSTDARISDIYGGVNTHLIVTDNTDYNLVNTDTEFGYGGNYYTAKQLRWYLTATPSTTPTSLTLTSGAGNIQGDGRGSLDVHVANASTFYNEVNGAYIVGVYTLNHVNTIIYQGQVSIDAAAKGEVTKTYTVPLSTNSTDVLDSAKFGGKGFLNGTQFIGTNNKFLKADKSRFVNDDTAATLSTVTTPSTGRNFDVAITDAESGNVASGSNLTAHNQAFRNGVYYETYYIRYTDDNETTPAVFVAQIKVIVSISAGPEIEVKEGNFTYSNPSGNTDDADKKVIELDLTTNKTFDLKAHTYSNKDNTTYSYSTDTENVTIDQATGVVTAAKVGTAIVTITPKADGVTGSPVDVFFRVRQNPNDVITVTGKDGDKATVLTTRQFNGNSANLGSERALAAAQVGYVQVEVTGDETTDVKENLTVKGAGTLSYALVNDSDKDIASVDAKTGQITVKHDYLNNHFKTSNYTGSVVFPVKITSTETATSALTTEYFYVVVDYADASITGLEDSYDVGTSLVETNASSYLNLGIDKVYYDDVLVPVHVSSNADIVTTQLTKDSDLDDSKLYENDDASAFIRNGNIVRRAIASGKTEHVLVSASKPSQKIGETYRVVTLKSVAGLENYVTKIENVETGKTVYQQGAGVNTGASITINKPTVVKVTVAHAPSAALNAKIDPAFRINGGEDEFNYNTWNLFVAATENPNTYEINLIPSAEGTQIVDIVPTQGRLSASDYSLVRAEDLKLAVKYSTADSKTPAQVKGVKLGNKKGAKVVVKFTKDTTDKNIKYYVQKKVGKKTSGKSVGSNRTILSVKKGATVKVRVKAYYYDANGVKHVGKYSKWVTKKTDKK